MANPQIPGDINTNLQSRFLSTRGVWNEDWAALLQQSPRYFQYYLNLRAAAGLERNRLPAKIQEFICIAVAACTTHIHGPAIRCHIQAARAIGATADEIMDVIGLTSLVGIHTVTLGTPILQELIKEESIATESDCAESENLNPERQRIKDDFIRTRGFWTDTWNPLLKLDPIFFEVYFKVSANASHCSNLEPKYRELIFCAFDAATTHLYGPGTKIHIHNTLRLSATPGEVMEMLEITSLMAIDGVTMGAGLLVGDLEREQRPGL
jgi:alkylhydroperoxidase/carboxymuconolactone decarboxylase family protein YurZ